MEALLADEEDPLITSSWLSSLEDVRRINNTQSDTIKHAIKTAMAVVANKWVAAYLRKSLTLLKQKDVMTTKRAIVWLVDRVKEARPDLFEGVRESQVLEIRAKVIEDAKQQMDKLPTSALAVKEEDLVSEAESDDDDSEDESDDEDMTESGKGRGKPIEVGAKDDSEMPSSFIPPRPSPTLVDLLLPPFKPNQSSEFLNPFTWPQLAGGAACRILHRMKRLRNEVDDALRGSRDLPQLTVAQRRERESASASRVFTECCAMIDGESFVETAAQHLCNGRDYLELTPVERLCIMRVMIEAAYDTHRVQQVVDGNFKQRINALKALEAEERKAKSEAKKKLASAEKAAREQLSAEARNKFLEEKRSEIRKVNEGSNEFTEEFMESLTDEDIIEFDEDIKADFAALPAPESFSKIDVNKMVARMQEEAAFETHSVRVVAMDELLLQEEEQLKVMEQQLATLVAENPDPDEMDRDTSKSIDRLRRTLEKSKEAAEILPDQRQVAILILRDAIADGTIKVLKSAIREAKLARLTGEDETSGGVWVLDLMRDAVLELENAKKHKRVADAQKDLVAKRNKCFIRNMPIGQDRFRNRFWHFDKDDHSHFWAEANYVVNDDESKPDGAKPVGFLDLARPSESVFIGATDEEEDLIGKNDPEPFRKFSRQEYHASGVSASLAKMHWGCHATEKSIRTLIKDLESRGRRENELKSKLKEAIEDNVGSGEKQENAKETGGDTAVEDDNVALTSGDEDAYKQLVSKETQFSRDGISAETVNELSSGIGAVVRMRIVVDGSKEPVIARYESGKIVGFRKRVETTEAGNEDEEENMEAPKPTVAHDWQGITDRGRIYWLSGVELLESITRHVRWKNKEKGYFEFDAAFHSYRNPLGRHCGRAADAPYSSSPMAFARYMVKKEQELYSKLKNRNYDNNWGGKSGARAVWTNSMKDYTFDFRAARDGLLTLENAFYELMDGRPSEGGEEGPNGKDLLDNRATRDDIELESLDNKNITSLWNTPESRAVFHEIVSSKSFFMIFHHANNLLFSLTAAADSKTTGFLALAFDLLCRNTTAYLAAHKLLNVKEEPAHQPVTRSTRRLNAWQQANAEADW
jgi:Williams-Beuren syndrome DDT (WSD), D-TOX E motif